MRSVLVTTATVLLLVFSATGAAPAQGASAAAVNEFFNGQRMLVTYREGGPLYGTVFTLDVHFCRSGRYMTLGESRRRTVLDNEQVNRFTDEGAWEVASVRGQMVLRYLSVSGQPNVVAINVAANGRVSLGDGISLVRQGAAQCQR